MTERGSLDRQQAAELLGVPAEASRAQVQAAFRRRARDAHPDTSGALADPVDLDELGRARDLLLTAPGATIEPTHRTSAPTSVRPRAAPVPSSGAPAASGLLWSVIVGGFVLLLLAVLVVVVIGLINGDDGPEPASVGDCVIVTDDVVAAPCDTASAQRVVATMSGVRDCPTGTNGLTVGSITWCLEPTQSE